MKIARFVSSEIIYVGQLLPGHETARRIVGNPLGEHSITDDVLKVDHLLAPLVPTDIFCIGVNYARHAAETNSPIPPTPMLFIKASGALNDPGAAVVLPHNSKSVDY